MQEVESADDELFKAIRRNDIDKVRSLLHCPTSGEIPDVDKTEWEGNKKWSGHTPFSWAVGLGHDEMVELLLSEGANPSGDCGWTTPVHVVREGKNALKILRMLKEAGADLDETVVNHTALDTAVYQDNVELVKAFLALGSDPSLVTAPKTIPCKKIKKALRRAKIKRKIAKFIKWF
jgi:hypothetical protein